MADKMINEGPIYSDVCKYVPSPFEQSLLEGMTLGFPCQVLELAIIDLKFEKYSVIHFQSTVGH